jgi:hypothetical protein
VTPRSTIGGHEPPAAAVFVLSAASPFLTALPVSISTTVPFYQGSLIEASIGSAFAAAGRELTRYARYPVRWDGYRANPFDAEVLGNAAAILGYARDRFMDYGVIPELVTTGPASDGSVDVEFRVGDRQLMLTLYPGEDVRLSSFQRGGGRGDASPLGKATLEGWIDWVRSPSDLPPDLAAHQVDTR